MYHVLVVDDEYYIADDIASKLKRLALPAIGQIRVCYSGEEALALCREEYRPQIVITDIKMGGMDGIALIHQLHPILFPVRFLILSGYDDYEYLRNAFVQGADDYLLKPLLSEQLRIAMEKLCGKLDTESYRPAGSRAELFDHARELGTLFQYSLSPQDAHPVLQRLCEKLPAPLFDLAVFAWRHPQPEDEVEARTHQLYDEMAAMGGYTALCVPLAHERMGVLLNHAGQVPGGSQQVLAGLLSRWHSEEQPAAAALAGPVRLEDVPGLFGDVEAALAQRLTEGYGRLYIGASEADSGALPKLRIQLDHLLTSMEPLRLERYFLEDEPLFQKLSARELTLLYDYVMHRLAGLSLESRAEAPDALPFSGFATREQLAAFLSAQIQGAVTLRGEEDPSRSIAEMAKRRIDEELNQSITLAGLARHYNVSYTHMSRILHEHLGMPFLEYITLQKMGMAVKLLKDPLLSVQDIAERTGYNNIHNFSRAFKKHFGVSPSQYRSR